MRSLPEWIGKTDDTAIPARVLVRVFERFKGLCCSCTVRLGPAVRWQCDHIVSLVNGGQNRESNLQLLCIECHRQKTDGDVAVKAKTYGIQKRHLGIRKAKGRPMPGTKASGIRKRMNGRVESW